MSHTSTHRVSEYRGGDFETAVLRATVNLVLDRGVQSVRSADVAERASTTESRLFRQFGNLPSVVAQSFDWCWREVNRSLADASFSASTFEPQAALMLDLLTVLELRRDPDSFETTVGAFLYFRRPEQITACLGSPPPNQVRYQARLEAQCAAYLDIHSEHLKSDSSAAKALALRLMNYSATAFLTWFLMPTGSDDMLDERHDLSVDEVLFGAHELMSRFLRFNDREGADLAQSDG